MAYPSGSDRSPEFADYLLDPSGHGQSKFHRRKAVMALQTRKREAGYGDQFNDSDTIDWQLTRRRASEKVTLQKKQHYAVKTWILRRRVSDVLNNVSRKALVRFMATLYFTPRGAGSKDRSIARVVLGST